MAKRKKLPTIFKAPVEREYVFPYKLQSRSGKVLAEALGVRRLVGPENDTTYRPRESDKIINWGRSTDLGFSPDDVRFVNSPLAVAKGTDKLAFLGEYAGHVSVVPFTTERAVAESWQGLVVERHNLRGHSGSGIRLVDVGAGDRLHDAPLYTKYIPKKAEFRVHFAFGKIIDVQEKKVRRGAQPNWRVQNAANGFVFAREGVVLPAVVEEECTKFIAVTDLQFGALDILYNEKYNKAYILEVNTAPGLEGQTIQSYVGAFKENGY